MTTAVTGTGSKPGTTSTTDGTKLSHKSWSSMDATDFLKLLTTQLKNQDPTAPMDNAQMVAQLAQFSSLSAANTTNSKLQTISDQIGKLAGKVA